jgi:hypothetical protein
MAIIDNTIAAQVPTFDPATPLMQAAKLQAADQESRQAQFKQAQIELGTEARGLAAVQNSPEFPKLWAEAADRMKAKGLLDDRAHAQWRNTPSPLLLKQMIAQTEDPTLQFRKERAGVEDKQWAAGHSLAQRRQALAEDDTPEGFQKRPDGTYAPLPGGPQDPSYLARVSQAEGKKNTPAGFEPDPIKGGLRPIAGGPADPEYLRQKGDRQNAPSGYQWNDPADPSKGMTAIPGGPGEKVDAEVAGRLGLAKSFLGQLPDIKEKIAAGGLSGLGGTTAAVVGMGQGGELRRQMDSGAEALLRMLTGAGMNKDEASEYVRRYKFNPKTDIWGPETAISKMNQLERELNEVGEMVGKGRGGWTPPGGKKTEPKAKPEASKQDAQGFRAPPKVGEVRDGYKFKGGNPGDPASWAKVGEKTGFNDRFDAAFARGD